MNQSIEVINNLVLITFTMCSILIVVTQTIEYRNKRA